MTPEPAKILRMGATLIESGRVTGAVGLLSTVARAQPRLPDALARDRRFVPAAGAPAR